MERGVADHHSVAAPLSACCEATAGRLTAHDDVGAQFPWVADARKSGRFYRGQAGFSFELGGGQVVVSSWLFVVKHLRGGHGPRAWEDFLHAAAAPCLVLEDTTHGPGRPRYARYRLRDGLESTFRFAVVEDFGEGRLLLVTAFDKKSLTGGHYRALREARVGERCPAFCLRTRDVHPKARGPRRVDRIAPCATAIPDDACCEHHLACLNRGPAAVEGMA
ncbi:MAG TPA: hypothetical protein VM263_10370 [Acidimicrobiales bacterium]|nr:hypothetical protein [Acidimicrobiales bacterium]